MDHAPDTRASLLVRLQGTGDEDAWAEFVEIYTPAIYRLIRREGLQHADAEDLTQQALVAVASAIKRWTPGEHAGSFRAWLFRVARNLMINFVTRLRSQHVGVGGTSFAKLLDQQPSAEDERSAVVDQEYRAAAFRWAAGRVRTEFREQTWQAFWDTAVEGQPIAETARRLGMSVGSVYAARSRVMARLKRKLSELEAETQSD